MHKNELRTRQKTLENLRFEFVNSHQSMSGQIPPTGSSRNVEEGSASAANEVGYHKIV